MHSGPSCERSAPGNGHGRVGLWNPCCKCLFSGVPDDMLLHHLYPFLEKRDLARSSAVCTRWSFMCSFPSLWRRVSTPDDGIHNSAQLLAVLGRHGSGVTALRVHRAVELHDDDLDRLVRSCPNLAEFEMPLQECISAACWARLAARLRHLTTFAVPGTMADDRTCAALAALPRLQVLRLRHCGEVTDSGLLALAVGSCAGTLRVLDVGSLPSASAAAVVELVRRLPCLRSLRADNGPHWDDASFLALCEAAPALLELDISASDPFSAGLPVTDDGVRAVLRRKPDAFLHMRTLSLAGARLLTPTSLTPLLSAARRLSLLDVVSADLDEAGAPCRVCQLRPALCMHRLQARVPTSVA